jgi:DNA-binding protein YbaB
MDERIESEVAEELRSLESERTQLQRKLDELAQREHTLRAEEGAVQQTLEGERHALEELLDEALSDLARKDEELRSAESQLKRASKGDRGGRREREAELWGRRMRTLYKNLEVDDRAIHDLAALGDESHRLRAEEAMKRLSDDLESAAVRRKVGGLPSHLTIFELGFAGKGRIYYTTGRQRRFRVLLIGAKNTQKPDLEYLSRLPRE